MKVKYTTSNFVSVVKEFSDDSSWGKIVSAYRRIDRMGDDCAWDETNEELVFVARRLVAAVSEIQRKTGTRIISRYLANDAQLVAFALEVYDLFNEKYACSYKDSYTVAV